MFNQESTAIVQWSDDDLVCRRWNRCVGCVNLECSLSLASIPMSFVTSISKSLPRLYPVIFLQGQFLELGLVACLKVHFQTHHLHWVGCCAKTSPNIKGVLKSLKNEVIVALGCHTTVLSYYSIISCVID